MSWTATTTSRSDRVSPCRVGAGTMTALRRFASGTARVVLGGFVAWQSLYLFAGMLSNADEAFGGPLHRHWPGLRIFTSGGGPPPGGILGTLDEIDREGMNHYGPLTGQPQGWSLFAPDVADGFAFPVVELRWDDEYLDPGSVPVHDLPPVMLRSPNAPADLSRFFRFTHFRFRRYESVVLPPDAQLDVF